MRKLIIPTVTSTGNKRNDYYLINGCPDLAVLPQGLLKGVNDDTEMPIRLPYGNMTFGAQHIATYPDRMKWIKKFEPSGCITTFIWRKLQERGDIYSVEDEKKTILLRITPSTLVVLKPQQGFFSITTFYPFENRKPSGKREKVYDGRIWGTKLVADDDTK